MRKCKAAVLTGLALIAGSFHCSSSSRFVKTPATQPSFEAPRYEEENTPAPLIPRNQEILPETIYDRAPMLAAFPYN